MASTFLFIWFAFFINYPIFAGKVFSKCASTKNECLSKKREGYKSLNSTSIRSGSLSLSIPKIFPDEHSGEINTNDSIPVEQVLDPDLTIPQAISQERLDILESFFNSDNINAPIDFGCRSGTKDQIFPNSEGMNALHWACKKAKIEVVEYLLKKGADINAATKIGGSALFYTILGMHEFCSNNDPHDAISIIKLLISSGIDVFIKNSNGQDVFYWARALEPQTSVFMTELKQILEPYVKLMQELYNCEILSSEFDIYKIICGYAAFNDLNKI